MAISNGTLGSFIISLTKKQQLALYVQTADSSQGRRKSASDSMYMKCTSNVSCLINDKRAYGDSCSLFVKLFRATVAMDTRNLDCISLLIFVDW